MTKKSAARLARDEHLQNNTAWDDLNRTRDAIFQAINFELQILAIFFSEEPLMAMVPENQRDRVNSSLATLKADNATLMEIYQRIAASHTGKSGRVTTNEDGARAYEAYMAYMDLTARFEQLDQPLIDYLNGVREEVTNRVAEIEIKIAQQAEAAAEQAAAAEGVQTPEATVADQPTQAL